MQYRVTWEIDVYADSPEDAAREAFAHMQRPGTTATVFDIVGEDDSVTRVDLSEGTIE